MRSSLPPRCRSAAARQHGIQEYPAGNAEPRSYNLGCGAVAGVLAENAKVTGCGGRINACERGGDGDGNEVDPC